jgi:hypothetical protein
MKWIRNWPTSSTRKLPELDLTGSAAAPGRVTNLVATGCLIVLIPLFVVLVSGIAYLSYLDWHLDKVNSENREKALASILKQAHDRAGATVRALDTNSAVDADPDAVIGVIWQHSETPVITYDATRREFTATVSKAAWYDSKSIMGGGGDQVTRCFVYSYSHPPGQAWTSRVSEREREDRWCSPSDDIGRAVSHARRRISNMYAEGLTRTGVQKALDPTGRLRSYDVKSVVHKGDTVTVSIRISNLGQTVNQCYRFTRTAPGTDVQREATAVPVLSC